MTKITKNNLSKRIAKYGALSLAIAGVADATGQVVYTDVDPDFVGGLGDSFAIDFDGDSVDDLTILQSNNGNYELVQANTVGPNGVVANSNGYLYASNLAYGTPIDGGLTFYSGGASFCAGVGYLGSAFCGTGEGYLGVRFDAGGGTTHYAWVRVDIGDSSNFIVLDYAFEATPDTAIDAGDQGSLGLGDQAFNDFNYFISENRLNLSAATAMEQLTIHNILGQQVIERQLSSTSEVIDIAALKSGIYLATVSIEGTRKTIKFVR
ncbi:MAG: T9SS type A sorting domain-containing protein [Eudoraea sp.]|nr:T9SS type A sorting domain-containing protein [Eudoraea sp.]